MGRVFIVSAKQIKAAATLTGPQIRRNAEAKEIVMRCYEGDTEGFYEEDGEDSPIYSEVDEQSGKLWEVWRCWLCYTENYDENGRRVKKGSKVPGTTYFTVSYDDETYDEVNIAQKTKEDAIAFLKYCKANRRL